MASTIESVLQQNTDQLMQIPGVVGVAQGLLNEKPCIIVYVVEKTSEINQKIPQQLSNFPVDIIESGEIRALPKLGL